MKISCADDVSDTISIHALHEESDSLITMTGTTRIYFNPRSP